MIIKALRSLVVILDASLIMGQPFYHLNLMIPKLVSFHKQFSYGDP